MSTTANLLQAARLMHKDPSRLQSLRILGAAIGMSPFHLQRAFVRIAGESPARFSRRTRVFAAASDLLRTDAPLRQIAWRSGFTSTEVLIRNFRPIFGCTPAQFRRRLRIARREVTFRRSLARLDRISACLSFFHVPSSRIPTHRSPAAMPMLSATLRTLQPQPALIIRSRIPREAIAATIGQNLGRIVPHALGAGGTLAGQPFARYPEFGPGLITIEVGMPLAAPVPGKDDIETVTLPAGLTAVAVHGGPYEKLPASFAALEQWIAAQGRQPAGPPWEVYVTDPAEHPNHDDWRTEIYWPVR